jgi:hypothetical protein
MNDIVIRLDLFMVGCFVLFALGLSIFKVWTKAEIHLDQLVNRSLAASAIPSGIAMIACALDPPLAQRITGVNLSFAVAGVSLLWVAGKGALAKL